jgi:hypothetical protein
VRESTKRYSTEALDREHHGIIESAIQANSADVASLRPIGHLIFAEQITWLSRTISFV